MNTLLIEVFILVYIFKQVTKDKRVAKMIN